MNKVHFRTIFEICQNIHDEVYTLYGDEVIPIGQGRHSKLRNYGRIKHMFVRFCQKQIQKLLQPHISFRNFTKPCKVENHNNLVSTIC